MVIPWTEAHLKYPGLTKPQRALSGEAIVRHNNSIQEVILTTDMSAYKHRIATDQEPPTEIYMVDENGDIIYQLLPGQTVRQVLQGLAGVTDHVVIVDYNHPTELSHDLTIIEFSNILDKLALI